MNSAHWAILTTYSLRECISPARLAVRMMWNKLERELKALIELNTFIVMNNHLLCPRPQSIHLVLSYGNQYCDMGCRKTYFSSSHTFWITTFSKSIWKFSFLQMQRGNFTNPKHGIRLWIDASPLVGSSKGIKELSNSHFFLKTSFMTPDFWRWSHISQIQDYIAEEKVELPTD